MVKGLRHGTRDPHGFVNGHARVSGSSRAARIPAPEVSGGMAKKIDPLEAREPGNLDLASVWTRALPWLGFLIAP